MLSPEAVSGATRALRCLWHEVEDSMAGVCEKSHPHAETQDSPRSAPLWNGQGRVIRVLSGAGQPSPAAY
eukprot:6741565-Prymnesium_polylepis.1